MRQVSTVRRRQTLVRGANSENFLTVICFSTKGFEFGELVRPQFQAKLSCPQLAMTSFDRPLLASYHPWRLFEWWFFYDADAPDAFNVGGNLLALVTAITSARQARQVSTYGSAHWAGADEAHQASRDGAASSNQLNWAAVIQEWHNPKPIPASHTQM
ncbi:hypothetical protein D9M68_562870 [compost metagenome]